MTEKYFETDKRTLILQLFTMIYANWKNHAFRNMQKNVHPFLNTSIKMFVEVPEKNRDSLQIFAFICNLSFDIYVKKQIVEKLLDNSPNCFIPKENQRRKIKKKK